MHTQIDHILSMFIHLIQMDNNCEFIVILLLIPKWPIVDILGRVSGTTASPSYVINVLQFPYKKEKKKTKNVLW